KVLTDDEQMHVQIKFDVNIVPLQLRLILSTEDKENYLEHYIPALVAQPGQQVPPKALATHAAWVKGQKEELKALYSEQAKQELLQIVRKFHTCKQEEGQSVSSHVLKMKGYINNLERLGQLVGQNLAVSLILVSLNKDFDSFMQNYNMLGMGKTVNELHAMLKLHEETLPKKDANLALHAIRAGRVQKNQKNKPHKVAKGGHGKTKGYAPNNAPFAPKPKTPPPPKKDNHAKDAICHQCGEIRHWRRNCLVYLAELMKKKKLSQGASTSGALSLYVGDGHRAIVEAIGTYHLELPIGLVIVLNNCHYVLSITRGVILVSRLFGDGFINRFDDNNVILVSKNNLVYFMVVPWDGIFEIDMSCSNTNDRSMYATTNKRAKINLDSSLLWHCRLGPLARNALKSCNMTDFLNSIDIESLGKCVSCLSGKMARKPYLHKVERAKDLLGLIHTDVWIVLKCAKITKKRDNIFTRLEDPKKSQIKKQVFSQ
nr:zinc finger, CCHC-type [Tanacetum cinerariifolium]